MSQETCNHCGTTLNLHGCIVCSAPVCCPKCCRETMVELEVSELAISAKVLIGNVVRVCENSRMWNGMGWTYHPPALQGIYEEAVAILDRYKALD